MKICFVIPSLSLGGLENAAAVMAGYLAAEGHNLTIVTIYRFPHFYSVDHRIRVIDPPYRKSGSIKLFYYLRTILFIRRNLKTWSPDRVVSYGDWSNILVIMAGLGINTRIFISDRASPDLEFQWYVKFLRQRLYPHAHGIIAQTERAAQQKRRMVGNQVNVKVLYNPVKTVLLNPDIRRKNQILGVGRHWPVKGLDRLLKAFATIDRKDYRLVIAGSEGPATGELKQLVADHGMESEVSFLGRVREMDRLYSECRIFVLPSRSEGFPNALIEAMAGGMACISFDCSAGPSEIITQGEDGILVEQDNIPQLAARLQFLIDHEQEIERLGKNALKIRDRLSLNTVGKQFMDYVIDT